MQDYKARRSGILKALTTDFDRFFQACAPDRDNLCLFGHSTGAWSVDLPAEEVCLVKMSGFRSWVLVKKCARRSEQNTA